MNIVADGLSTSDIYKLLVGGITPRPIAWISTRSEQGVDNIAPYSFFSVASVNPPILSYTQVNPQTDSDKDTLTNLLATKECVVHIVNSETMHKMNLSCAGLPPEKSEFELYDFNQNLISKGQINNLTNINVSNFKKGRYILLIITNGNYESHQIIIN